MDPLINEIKDLIESQGKAWGEFKKANDMRLENLEKEAALAQQDQLKMQRPGATGGTSQRMATPETFFDVKTKRQIPVLSHSHSLAGLEKKEPGTPSDFAR